MEINPKTGKKILKRAPRPQPNPEPPSFVEELNKYSKITKVIGVASGKGGVGKSSTTSLLATAAQKLGYSVGILDADITGPSIPKAFGIEGKANGSELGILPRESENGIKIISVNLILDDVTQPVIMRGPIIGNMVKQFWSDVYWGDLDFLFIDMPPGTGDVPLTIYQSIKLDGIILVTTPQDLVAMIVEKAVNMSKIMDIPMLGIIENMSYFLCPDNGKKYEIFGKSKINDVAQKMGLTVLGQMPIDPKIAELCDAGRIEDYDENPFAQIISKL